MVKARRARATAKKKKSPAKAKPKPKIRKTPKKRARARRHEHEHEHEHDLGVPEVVAESSSTGRRRALTARERFARSSPVVDIIDDPHPIGALRRFLETIRGTASEQQAQIALGAAQLLLLSIARENRGGAEVKELVDLLLERWPEFGARRAGYHAQEFLRNALAAIGVDRDRIARLVALVPANASIELRFEIACAYAVARDKVAMLRAVEAALEAGASPTQLAGHADFAPYRHDPDLRALLARAEVPRIPVDVAPHVAPVRAALDRLVGTLRELGERPVLRPPARLEAILDAERAAKISLPNDYRALLTITNGMIAFGYEFFGVGDYRETTKLARRARSYLEQSGNEDCVPLVGGDPDGQASTWLLYDPLGRARGGEPGYVKMLASDTLPFAGLVAALDHLESTARDVLGTN